MRWNTGCGDFVQAAEDSGLPPLCTAQRWRFEDQGDDTSRLVNVHSAKVLDVADCGTADGTAVRQWAWLNNTCQQWRLQPA